MITKANNDRLLKCVAAMGAMLFFVPDAISLFSMITQSHFYISDFMAIPIYVAGVLAIVLATMFREGPALPIAVVALSAYLVIGAVIGVGFIAAFTGMEEGPIPAYKPGFEDLHSRLHMVWIAAACGISMALIWRPAAGRWATLMLPVFALAYHFLSIHAMNPEYIAEMEARHSDYLAGGEGQVVEWPYIDEDGQEQVLLLITEVEAIHSIYWQSIISWIIILFAIACLFVPERWVPRIDRAH